MGMLLDASLEHPSSTRCDCLVSSELSWSEMFRTNLELKLVLLNAFNIYNLGIWEELMIDAKTNMLECPSKLPHT